MINSKPIAYLSFFLVFTATFCIEGKGQGIGNSSNKENYLIRVQAYADEMIAHGRDRYGEISSPLFASALDRETMEIANVDVFGSIDGIRETDRSLRGSNPLWEIGLYEILYELTSITKDPKYADEADRTIAFFFDNCQSENTGLMAWGEHLFWDFKTEKCGFISKDYHEAKAWPFWDKSYQMSPEASWQFAIGEWDHQIQNKSTGDFSRHASYLDHGPQKGSDFPRYAGQMIERWAIALSRKENLYRPRREELMEAIEVLVRRMEENSKLTAIGYLPALRGADYVWPTSNLELARCLFEAAEHLNEPLKQRVLDLALKQDTDFLAADHLILNEGGFAVTLHSETGAPRDRSMNKPYTQTWATGYGYGTHAGTANLLHKRYKQVLPNYPKIANQYKSMIIAAADQYLKASPDWSNAQNPDAFAAVIQLMITSYQLTGNKAYKERADFFAQMGIALFLDENSALPKATSKHEHYETITGGPAFMHRLLKLDALNAN